MDLKKIILLGGVGTVSAVAGILIPTMMSGSQQADATAQVQPAAADAHDDHAKDSSGHDAKPAASDHDSHGGGHGKADGKDEKKPKDGPCFVPFGRIVVNLNEPMLMKFLSLDISIQTDGKNENEVKTALESLRPRLTTWLTSHLADKSIEDIRGKVGVNRLRREIQDNFNALLFKDGHERVQDIMFDEYHVQ